MSAPHDAQQARDAAFDALVERTLGCPVPDLTERVLAAVDQEQEPLGSRPSTPGSGQRLGAVAIVLLGLAAVTWAAWHRTSADSGIRPPTEDSANDAAQDPNQTPADGTLEPRLTYPMDDREGHRLLERTESAIARHSEIYQLWFPIGNGRARWLEKYDASTVRTDIPDPEGLVQLVRGCIDAPWSDPLGIPEQQVLVDFAIRGGQTIRAEFARKGTALQMRIRGLGYRTVRGKLARRVGELMDSVAEKATERYLFAADAQALADSPRTLREVFAYGVDDDGLATLGQRPDLVRARLVGRGVDENPNDYAGVDLGATAIEHLRACRSLQRLELIAANVDDAALEALAEIPSLRHLSITDGTRCDFSAKGLQHLARLPTLESIEFERCQIDDQGLRVLAALGALKRVRLEAIQPGSGAGLRGMLRSPSLQELSVAKVAARGLFEGALAPSLRRFECADSELTLDGIETLPKLERVALDACTVSPASVEALGRSRVEVLELDDMAVDAAWAAAIGPKMREVILGRIRATDPTWATILGAWRNAPELHSLAVRQSNLTDQRIEGLLELRHVRVLDIRYNRDLTQAAIDRLVREMPSTRVLFSEPE